MSTPALWHGEEPLVAVAWSKMILGRGALHDPSEMMKVLPLGEALTTAHRQDAHFHCYMGASPAGKVLDLRHGGFPRFKKIALTDVRHRGLEILSSIIVLDYDNHDPITGTKAPWPNDEAKIAFFQKALAAPGILSQFGFAYTTRNGARLGYILKEPIKPEDWEVKVAGVIDAWEAYGLTFDPACCDWTRLFRLPRVVRDGLSTDTDDLILDYRPSVRVSAADLPSGSTKALKHAAAGVRGLKKPQEQVPSYAEVQAFLHNKDLIREAKKALKGKPAYDAIWNNAALAPPPGPGRNTAVTSFAGALVSCLSRAGGFTAESVYAFGLHPVEQFLPDNDTPDWGAVLWGCVKRFWQAEDTRYRNEAESEMKVHREGVAIGAAMLKGMETWAKPEQLNEEWMKSHFVVAVGNFFYAMDETGHYGDAPFGSIALLQAHLNRRGLNNLIPTMRTNKEGQLAPVPTNDFILAHCTVAGEVEGIPGAVGGSLRNPDGNGATLIRSIYRQHPRLQPRFDADVDEWLRLFFGPAGYETGERWLAGAPLFCDYPIAALSLAGEAGAGKGMLLQGLSETLETPCFSKNFMGKHATELLRTPYLWVDENWPTDVHSYMHCADLFRQLVAGDFMMVEPKFQAPIRIKAFPRLLITANKMEDTLGKLMEGRNLSPDDRVALEQRLCHIDIGPAARHYLDKRGNRAWTSNKEKGCWAGGNDLERDFRIAKHILWLSENRRPKAEGRFLVMGNQHPTVCRMMQTQSGATSIVIRTIIGLVESSSQHDSFAVHGGRIYMLRNVLEERVPVVAKELGKRSPADPWDVMKGLIRRAAGKSFIVPGKERMGPRPWAELDTGVICQVAALDGFHTPKLDAIHRAWEAEAEAAANPAPAGFAGF